MLSIPRTVCWVYTLPIEDFYCDEIISAFRHTKPHWPVHIVVIPKTHIPDIFSPACDENLLNELFSVIRRVASRVVKEHGSCRILTNLGGYQDSKHLHWHVVFGEPNR